MKSLTMMTVSMILMSAGQAFAWGGSSSVGAGNPAAQRCIDVGGQLEIVTDAGGNQHGLCLLQLARIEEWTLFGVTNGRKSLATNAFLDHKPPVLDRGPGQPGGPVGMPNPASVYCGQAGGRLEFLNTESGQLGLCRFADRSAIEEWTLYGGPRASGNAKLTKILLGR